MKEFQSVFRNELEEYLKINQGTVNEGHLAEYTQSIAFLRFIAGGRKYKCDLQKADR